MRLGVVISLGIFYGIHIESPLDEIGDGLLDLDPGLPVGQGFNDLAVTQELVP